MTKKEQAEQRYIDSVNAELDAACDLARDKDTKGDEDYGKETKEAK